MTRKVSRTLLSNQQVMFMKSKSHRMLAQYLAERYLARYPQRYVRAFMLGCVEPDKNPTTYLKGSLRNQWLRGHNWSNSRRYMQRTANKLERKDAFRMLDFYRLGKLIHYTTDAFTLAHNASFQENLHSHVQYEIELHDYFDQYMKKAQDRPMERYGSVMDTIRVYHQDYALITGGIHTDDRFTYHVCNLVISLILPTAFAGSSKLQV